MNDPYVRTQTKAERMLRSLLNKWIKLLGISDWEIVVELANDSAMNNEGWEKGFSTAAECSAHWEYQRATLRFSLDWARKASYDEMEDTALHELMHAVLSEMREKGIKHEERTACMLTRAFLRTAKGAA